MVHSNQRHLADCLARVGPGDAHRALGDRDQEPRGRGGGLGAHSVRFRSSYFRGDQLHDRGVGRQRQGGRYGSSWRGLACSTTRSVEDTLPEALDARHTELVRCAGVPRVAGLGRPHRRSALVHRLAGAGPHARRDGPPALHAQRLSDLPLRHLGSGLLARWLAHAAIGCGHAVRHPIFEGRRLQHGAEAHQGGTSPFLLPLRPLGPARLAGPSQRWRKARLAPVDHA
mmetsp:Transcript_56325/g.182928  ORF Transcript_56325/g.182928 Transcript_56325/m.182928 type:complete len:228 (+) Transcript_56325:772-1455(+)